MNVIILSDNGLLRTPFISSSDVVAQVYFNDLVEELLGKKTKIELHQLNELIEPTGKQIHWFVNVPIKQSANESNPNLNYEYYELYPRRCDVTGEGMDSGYCVFNGEYYFKYQEDMIKWFRENVNNISDADLSDNEILEKYYEDGLYYWTEWQELNEDVNYNALGMEVEIY
jgi:hypothetical protein